MALTLDGSGPEIFDFRIKLNKEEVPMVGTRVKKGVSAKRKKDREGTGRLKVMIEPLPCFFLIYCGL